MERGAARRDVEFKTESKGSVCQGGWEYSY